MWVLTEVGALIDLSASPFIRVVHQARHQVPWAVVADTIDGEGYTALYRCDDVEHGKQIIARLAARIARGDRLVIMGDVVATEGVTTQPTPYQPSGVSRVQALVAAREIQAEGGRVTFRAVARRAGLKYSQVVYAWGRVAQLHEALRESA